MFPLRDNPKSMTASIVLLFVVFSFIIAFILTLSLIVGRPEPVTTSRSRTVTSSACHVTGNDTTCFRFASNFTARLCSALDGLVVNINSSVSSSSSSSSPAAVLTATCYHDICRHFVVDNRFCFLNRSHHLIQHRLFHVTVWWFPFLQSCSVYAILSRLSFNLTALYTRTPSCCKENARCSVYNNSSIVPSSDMPRDGYTLSTFE